MANTTHSEPKATTKAEWVSAAEARAILGRHPDVVARLARAGRIERFKAPGLSALYRRADVERLVPPTSRS